MLKLENCLRCAKAVLIINICCFFVVKYHKIHFIVFTTIKRCCYCNTILVFWHLREEIKFNNKISTPQKFRKKPSLSCQANPILSTIFKTQPSSIPIQILSTYLYHSTTF